MIPNLDVDSFVGRKKLDLGSHGASPALDTHQLVYGGVGRDAVGSKRYVIVR